jgi:hypothetical protein
MRISAIAAFALATAFLTFPACKKKTETKAIDPLEQADATHREPNHFLHKTFQVKKIVQFSFVVPPHAAIPHLQGTFSSFVPRPGDEPLADDTTNVDFLLLTPDQYSEYNNGNTGGEALYTTGPTHDHEVDYSLSPTMQEPATYFIVFRSTGGAPVKSVKADFTVTYGY